MKLAVMQPYFFPYIGYFQLLQAVDKFVFYDDVNYIKGGWINRNRLYLAGAVRYITVPLSGASPFEKINRVQIQPGSRWVTSMLDSVRLSYAKAPHYGAVSKFLEHVLAGHSDGSLAALARNSVVETARYLGLNKEFVQSSSCYGNEDKSGVGRVLDICRIERATEYFNLPGGRDLYSSSDFEECGIKLRFVDTRIEPYSQRTDSFRPGLSMLDVLMFNDVESVRHMLSGLPGNDCEKF